MFSQSNFVRNVSVTPRKVVFANLGDPDGGVMHYSGLHIAADCRIQLAAYVGSSALAWSYVTCTSYILHLPLL